LDIHVSRVSEVAAAAGMEICPYLRLEDPQGSSLPDRERAVEVELLDDRRIPGRGDRDEAPIVGE
jgi:hypothetical protein